MITKTMTVSRAPGTENTPMVKIANRTLDSMGFRIGSKVVVEYEYERERNVISISLRTNHESNNVSATGSSVALSAETSAPY